MEKKSIREQFVLFVIPWSQGKVNEMKDHLAMKCKGHVSKDIWLNFLREIDNEHESPETLSTSSKKQKISNNQTTLENFYDNNKIDEVKSNWADKALIKYGYNPPKRTVLVTTHLDGKLANVTLKIEKELAKAENLTLSDFNARKMLEVLEKVGPEKFSAIITDAESAMMAVKRQVANKYPHILPMRCIAHHIQLILSDTCNHSWAKKVLSDCQKIFSFFKNFYPADTTLRKEIFHTFTVLEQKPQIFVRVNATKNLINDHQFWINVEQLQNLIVPVKKAVKDVEFQNTILADVFVELVKIAIAIQEIPTPLNDQFCDNLTHNTYKKIILRKALEIWKQTGGGKKSAKILKTQMNLYRNQESPFDDDFIESVDTVKNWWSFYEFNTAFNQIAITMEEGIDLFEENDSFPVFDERIFDEFDDNEENNGLQLQNENGLNLEIGKLIQLNVKQSDSISDINESRIEHGDKNFSIEDLLQDD
ncbi:ribonuclease H-like domain-containing protein [Rhizophagus clarus]|uniref:Ribonuclease H-like domain-containing protein n=1 Tax=Rhizophagus clarus TaxID=94130 RepID=A0A8H3LW08_9GLOM|nr:ribonuclease H-like domain-containing protein [Rhizophagus clarus]